MSKQDTPPDLSNSLFLGVTKILDSLKEDAPKEKIQLELSLPTDLVTFYRNIAKQFNLDFNELVSKAVTHVLVTSVGAQLSQKDVELETKEAFERLGSLRDTIKDLQSMVENLEVDNNGTDIDDIEKYTKQLGSLIGPLSGKLGK